MPAPCLRLRIPAGAARRRGFVLLQLSRGTVRGSSGSSGSSCCLGNRRAVPEASHFDWKQKWKHLEGVRGERALWHDKGWEQQGVLIERGKGTRWICYNSIWEWRILFISLNRALKRSTCMCMCLCVCFISEIAISRPLYLRGIG